MRQNAPDAKSGLTDGTGRRLVIGAAVLALVLTLSGCLRFNETLVVEKDGSATLYRSFQMQMQVAQMMMSMSSMGNPDAAQEFSLLDEEELMNEAAEMGPGVELVSLEPFEDEWGEGYDAAFAIPDIEEFFWASGPGNAMGDMAATMGEEDTDYFTFAFEPGSTATLTVFAPQPGEADMVDDMEMGEMGEISEMGTEEMMMLSGLYEGMRISLDIEVNGRVASSNASYQDGSLFTILDLDMDGLMSDPADFQEFLESQQGDIEDPEVLNDLSGVRVETEDEIEIRFR